ncbi:hypothetical protein OCL06_02000 [Alteromonas sp. ASW11-19]|uniref:VWFA domain-containing protein n=1 Tax=Alteromonas salexigens TaxID=2982530 RepID=A0ABT2VJG2_9ALTE|nr:hypothetical protein [Alteromonas salexigens]MCU7553366.1 hypothetical protein [Alteromonas salexigens]
MKNLISLVIVTLLAVWSAKADAALIQSDIVIFMDESGSMGNDDDGGNYTNRLTSNIFSNLNFFNSSLTERDIEAHYAIVGFGGASGIRLLTDNFVSAATAMNDAKAIENTGNEENAFDAVGVALDEIWLFNDPLLTFTQGALKNFILFTDEVDNSQFASQGDVSGWLDQHETFFNTVLPGGENSLLTEFTTLANTTGGNAFDLNSLLTDSQQAAQAFMSNLGQVKANELVCQNNPNACMVTVSSPATSGLLLSAFAAVLFFGRRKVADTRFVCR